MLSNYRQFAGVDRKYFGDDDVVGKIMEVGKEKCEVGAVIRDLPDNSIFSIA